MTTTTKKERNADRDREIEAVLTSDLLSLSTTSSWNQIFYLKLFFIESKRKIADYYGGIERDANTTS